MSGVATDVLRLCGEALEALAGIGAAVTETDAPFENPEAVWFVVNGSYRMAQYGHHLAKHRAIMDPVFVRQMDRVATYSAQELYQGIFQRTTLFRAGAGLVRGRRTSSRCPPSRAPRCRSTRISSAPSPSTTRRSRTCARPGIPTRCPST